MTADFGPCSDWPVIWNCPELVSTSSPTATGNAVTAATEILWALSGRRYGTCEITLRPCRKYCGNENWLSWDYPIWSGLSYSGPYFDWYWLPQLCGACGNSCSCNQVPEVILPSPVSRIVSVKVDGVALVTGAYRVDDNRLLVRTDGSDWPRCNNLLLADTQVGTWSVTAEYGQEVPVAGRLAVGEMACEILKAMSGEDCRLPPGVTQLVRQGITISYPDVGQLLKDGRTGLYLVDLFLASDNPYGLAQKARVYSIDRPRHRRAGT